MFYFVSIQVIEIQSILKIEEKMVKVIKKQVHKLFESIGFSSNAKQKSLKSSVVELDNKDIELINYVLDKKYSMASTKRLINTVKSCRYVVENDIPGDFVECGVWRGGNGILAKMVFDRLGSEKKVWMFDTFEGMTAPTNVDVEAINQISADSKFLENQKETHNEWCYASIEDVKQNCLDSGIKINSFRFIKGDVCETLEISKNIPTYISVLRLDTDWYESTKAELETLYPKLSNKGVLIIDDYGHWEGARKAVDEYFSSQKYKPLFNIIDRTGRSAIKIEN